MGVPTINFKGVDYPLATTLRVAYKIQGQNDHAPYIKVLEGIGEMPVEKQIGVIYAAFVCGNKDKADSVTEAEFCDYCLDNMNISDLMDVLAEVSKGIMGIKDDESDKDNHSATNDQKNV